MRAASNRALTGALNFQIYGADFNVEEGVSVDHYPPIER